MKEKLDKIKKLFVINIIMLYAGYITAIVTSIVFLLNGKLGTAIVSIICILASMVTTNLLIDDAIHSNLLKTKKKPRKF